MVAEKPKMEIGNWKIGNWKLENGLRVGNRLTLTHHPNPEPHFPFSSF